MIEVCLGVAPYPQPKPERNAGGDCFACALAAALRHFYPERPVAFDAAWSYFMTETVDGTPHLSNTWPGMRRALGAASGDGYPLEVANDLVLPDFNVDHHSYPWWRSVPTMVYARRLEGYLRGGWVAFTEVRYAADGPLAPDGTRHDIDHFVILDGVRQGWEPYPGGRRWAAAVRVICSARGAFWVDLDEFLERHGGAGWWLCRRDER